MHFLLVGQKNPFIIYLEPEYLSISNLSPLYDIPDLVPNSLFISITLINRHFQRNPPRAQQLNTSKKAAKSKDKHAVPGQQKGMRQPRIERGAHRWQRWILPLNH
jgi:hypothetical protein